MSVSVTHNESLGRFEAHVDGAIAHTDYELEGEVMRLVHTEVPPRLEGRGLASRIVRAALAYARSRRLRVAPACSYVRGYMSRHPETHDLLAAGATLSTHVR